jgi:hypothetical protein
MLGLGVRLLLCSGFTWAAWTMMGPIALPMCAPLFGVAAAGPLMALFGRSWGRMSQAARQAAWHARLPYQGRRIRHFVDDNGEVWFCIDDIHKVVPGLPTARSLQALYPGRCTNTTWRQPAHLRVDAAEALLGKATDRSTLRFVRWMRAAGRE